MAAEVEDSIITFIFNGEDRNDIPRDVTHLIIHESITVIPARLFSDHPNLVEVYCHAGVTKIEHRAFFRCRSLRRVIIPGVIILLRQKHSYGVTTWCMWNATNWKDLEYKHSLAANLSLASICHLQRLLNDMHSLIALL